MTSNLITAVTTLRESMAALRVLKGGDRAEGKVARRAPSVLGLVEHGADDLVARVRGGVDERLGRDVSRLVVSPTGIRNGDRRADLVAVDRGGSVRGFVGRRVLLKANSAESILRYCLSCNGWVRRWKAGKLTGRQHLKLLADIRKYGRAWLRHEAMVFFETHGVKNERALDYRTSSDGGSVGFGRGVVGSRDVPESGAAEEVSERVQRSADGELGREITQPTLITEGEVSDGSQDAELHNRRDSSEGQAASIARATAEVAGSINEIHRGLASSILSPFRRWFDRTVQFVRELIFAGTMSMAGTESLSADDIAAAENQTRKQHEYLDGFRRELEANPPPELATPHPAPYPSTAITVGQPKPMSTAQAIARAEMYGNAVWESTINIMRESAIKQGVFQAERRVHKLRESEHHYCKTCIAQSQKGWQPVGSLLEIGDSECMGNCDCYFEWRDYSGKIFVSPWGRHNPKGYNQPGASGARLPGIAFPADKPQPHLPFGPDKPDLPPPADEVGGSLLKGETIKLKPVKVQPIEPHEGPAPQEIIGPWVDGQGNAITYHFEGLE